MWRRLARLGTARLSTRFALASAVILCVGALTLGFLVTREIEQSVIRRVAADSALYVDALVGPYVDGFLSGPLSDDDRARLGAGLERARRSGDIVSIKIWMPDGSIAYATDATLVGRTLESKGLASALGGSVVSARSHLEGEENAYERAMAESLIETYIPLRDATGEKVIAVAEFYQLPDLLQAELDRARLSTWGLIAIATVAMYVLLAGMVRRGSDTIEWQRESLMAASARLRELSMARVQTEEEQRGRLARELHDGLTQDLATALLTLGREDSRRARLARAALESALVEAHTLARGLALPQLATLDLTQVVDRACADHERKIGRHVPRTVAALPPDASIALKTATYRILQEALSNAFHHAGDAAVGVTAASRDGVLLIECADAGPGFASGTVEGLGIRSMRERAELLGGTLEIGTTAEGGTAVRAALPLGA